MKIIHYSTILFVFLSLFFLFSSCEHNLSKAELNKEKTKLDSLAQQISDDFSQVRQNVTDLAIFITKTYENQDNYKCINSDKYKIDPSGVYYKPINDGGSAVFVSGIFPIDETIRKIVCFTEPIDSVFIQLIASNPAIAQVYYNDRFSYNRIYPYFDVLTQYEAKMDIPDYNFYYLADEKHNPQRKAVWVSEPYVDPAGRGWMVSAIAPVYYNNFLEGVPGIDITISEITDRYFKTQNKDIIVVDSSGVIVSADEYVINLLAMPTLKAHKYFETIKQDTYLKDDYNLLKSKNEQIRNSFSNMLRNNSESEVLKLENDNYQAVISRIEELGWFLIKIVKI